MRGQSPRRAQPASNYHSMRRSYGTLKQNPLGATHEMSLRDMNAKTTGYTRDSPFTFSFSGAVSPQQYLQLKKNQVSCTVIDAGTRRNN